MIHHLNTIFSNKCKFSFTFSFKLFVCLYSNVVLADPVKTVYSIVSVASWTNSSHWSLTSGGASCSCTPGISKDIIYIETNTNSAIGLTLGASVNVTIKNNALFTVTGNTTFTNGSILNVFAGSTFSIIGDLTNNNNSDEITIAGDLTVSGNFLGGTGSKILGTGDLNVAGTVTTTGTGLIFGSTNDFGPGPWVLNTTVLPIELVYFKGKNEGRVNQISWMTSSEINNDFYTIERSTDGKLFEIVTIVQGVGNSLNLNNYSIDDVNFPPEINYYHLKQTDFDGKYDFSEIISIDNRQDHSTKEVVSINNLLGQEVNEFYRGCVIVTYKDGSSIKKIQ